MSEFNPGPNESLTIAGYNYIVKPHPSVPAFAFGQEGRKAFVYQIGGGPNNELYALKKFKVAYRLPELVDVCDSLARFAQWRGLEVCGRQCLHQGIHDDVLSEYPDLEYAALMPWITGSTWYDIVISATPLSRLEAMTFANATAQVLASLEEAGLAHCDIAAPNIIINGTTGRAHLIDVEDLYVPGFPAPSALPAGTEGYAHLTSPEGLWKASGDRFAGAVIMAEMAGWHDPRIRKQADEEHYFAGNEMQQDSPRYQLMREVLTDLNPTLSDLFEQAWLSPTLEDCPPLKTWAEAVSEVYHRESLAKVVSDWQPIVVPGVNVGEVEPQPISVPPLAEKKVAEVQPGPAKSQPQQVVETPKITTPSAQPVPVKAQPNAPIVQPTIAASQPPAIHAPTSGGPVIEWVPLSIPQQQPEAHSSNGHAAESVPIMPTAPEKTRVAKTHKAEITEPIRETVQPEATQTTRRTRKETREDNRDQQPASSRSVHTSSIPKPVLDLSHIDNLNRPMLVWSETQGATGYVLEEANNPDFQSAKEIKVKGGETKWQPMWGRSGRLYYRVRAILDNELGPWSDALAIRIGAKS